MNLPRPSAKTATTPADLANWLAAAYDVLLPLSADAISPARIPALLAITMPTLDELRATRGDPNGLSGPRACILAGKVDPLDGGEGVFIWNVTSIAVDDDGVTTVESPAAGVPDGAPGRWIRHTPQVIIPPPPQADIQEFSADGMWTKPAVVNGYSPKWVRIELVPWGASGAGGGNTGEGTAGGASGVGVYEGPASLFGATEAVTFGAQPLGSAGSAGAAANGTDAPDATFGAWLRVAGGKKGLAGGGAGGLGGYGNMGTGGKGGGPAGAVGLPGTGRAAGGGGGGGAAGGNGGNGGNAGPDRATNLTGGTGGAGAGGAASSGAVGELGGGGGGAGGAGGTGGSPNGFNGSAGGRYGAGGGGGGGIAFGGTGGNGGDSGLCFGRVTTWF